MDTTRSTDAAATSSPGSAEAAGRYAELQQQWHGWGSPVGLGLGLLCLGAGVGAVLVGIAAISTVGVLLS